MRVVKNMAIKMVAIDIDGTLVDNHKVIGKKTIEVIKEARKQGVYIVLCTGRPLSGVKEYLEQLDLVSTNDYAITFNGAKAEITATNETVFENLLEASQVKKLDELSHKLDIKGQVVLADSKVITTFRDISPYTVVDAFYTKMPLFYREPKEIKDAKTAKYMWVDEPAVIQEKLAVAADYFNDLYTVLSAPWFYEFMNPKAHKGAAVIELGEYLGIKREEIMCLGDENNDLTMFEEVGFGVAMGNANEQIKRLAKAVTTDNEHDGVGVAIEKYVLQK